MSHTHSGKADMKLFWACFIALVATSFVFGVRANTIGMLQDSFNLSESQKGDINGAGMWPFALSIILPSFMLACYLGLLLYFRSKGGYKPVDLTASHSNANL